MTYFKMHDPQHKQLAMVIGIAACLACSCYVTKYVYLNFDYLCNRILHCKDFLLHYEHNSSQDGEKKEETSIPNIQHTEKNEEDPILNIQHIEKIEENSVFNIQSMVENCKNIENQINENRWMKDRCDASALQIQQAEDNLNIFKSNILDIRQSLLCKLSDEKTEKLSKDMWDWLKAYTSTARCMQQIDDPYGTTHFYLITRLCHLEDYEILKVLFEKYKLKPNNEDETRPIPYFEGIFFDRGFSKNDCADPLIVSCYKNNHELVSLLIQHNINTHPMTDISYRDDSAIVIGLKNKNPKIVSSLFSYIDRRNKTNMMQKLFLTKEFDLPSDCQSLIGQLFFGACLDLYFESDRTIWPIPEVNYKDMGNTLGIQTCYPVLEIYGARNDEGKTVQRIKKIVRDALSIPSFCK